MLKTRISARCPIFGHPSEFGESQGCSLGLDVSVSRRSRDLFSKVSVSSRSRKILKGLGLGLGLGKKSNVSVSEPKVSFTSDILYYFGHITLEYNYQNKVVSYQCSIRYCFNPFVVAYLLVIHFL